MKGSKLKLIAAAALFVGWLAWLGYTALTKYRGPVVSHVQVEAAAHAVIGEVMADAEGKPSAVVKVTESLKANSPAAGTEIYLLNIGEAKGFEGPGEYLLLLTDNVAPREIPMNGKNLPMRALVGMQRSPGYEPAGSGPLIYRNSDGVRAQFQKLTR